MLDSEYVVCVNGHFSHDTDHLAFSSALKLVGDEDGIDCDDYKHAVVMPLAERNLDTLFGNERPPLTEVRILAKQLAEALSYVHSKGIIHGDLKAQNVVQIGGRLRLVDFGAAVQWLICRGQVLIRRSPSRNDCQARCRGPKWGSGSRQ
jgi:serine/threonine protein kinase